MSVQNKIPEYPWRSGSYGTGSGYFEQDLSLELRPRLHLPEVLCLGLATFVAEYAVRIHSLSAELAAA